MPELGLFGKIPAKGDFVRHNVVDDAARSFEQWVQESNDSLRGAGGDMPDQAIRVVFTPPGSSKTVVAVLVPSEDGVGRKFPIVFFALTASAQMASDLSTLPIAWATFMDAAAALGARAKTMDVEQLKTALDALPSAGTAEVAHAQEMGRKALGHPLASEVHARIFAGHADMHLYAYQTFVTAVQNSGKNDPGKGATVLDCPVRVDVDLFVWLELTRRLYGFPPAHPSYFWIEDPAPRLLVSLGPAPLNVLQLLSDPKLENQRLWPLSTDRDKAVDAARGSLGPVLSSLDVHSPLAALMDTLAQHAGSR
jgi:type VI secretion system protein ImpM